MTAAAASQHLSCCTVRAELMTIHLKYKQSKVVLRLMSISVHTTWCIVQEKQKASCYYAVENYCKYDLQVGPACK